MSVSEGCGFRIAVALRSKACYARMCEHGDFRIIAGFFLTVLDIIKFDRSMVIESGKNEASAYMVDTFASMFRKLNYRVLYEGVEDEMDEERCIQMYAQYLQAVIQSPRFYISRLRDIPLYLTGWSALCSPEPPE